MIAPSLLASLVAAAPAAAERPAREFAQGQLRSAGERTPVAGAHIYARAHAGAAWTRETLSDRYGRFVLADLPSRDFILTVVAAGHQRFEQPTTAAFWARRKPPVIYLQPAGAGSYRTIVQQERTTRPSPVSARLTPAEISDLPGSQGDPLRALQNLPGVARVPGGLGLVVLRGAAPNQSQVFFGEHPLPRAFHIPGLASVVQTGVLHSLEYVPGNFSAHYGNAAGGLVHLTPRVGRRDGVHGHVKLDITSAGALVEGPFGKGGSFLLAAQRGYLDLALRALPEETSRGALFSPRYHDYQFIFDYPAGRGGTITARILAAEDNLTIFAVPSDPRPLLSMQAGFNRVDLAYRKRHESWSFLLAPALRLDRNRFDAGGFLRSSDVVGLLRAEASVRPMRPLQLTIGLDTQLDRYLTRRVVPSGWWSSEEIDELRRGLLTTTGVYVSSQYDIGPHAVIAGARLNAFTSAGNAVLSVDPRLLVRWAPHEHVRFHFGAGLYSQPLVRPTIQTTGFVSNPGDPGPTQSFLFDAVVLPAAIRYLAPQLVFGPQGPSGAQQAIQYSASLHAELTRTLDLDATLFYRRVRDFLPDTPDHLRISSSTHGIEIMLRHELTARLFGWLAYTWMRSSGTGIGPWGARIRIPADFDQRHNLVMLIGYKLPRRWSIAARFRLVTGLPYTPYVGAVDKMGGQSFAPLVGAANSARMPVFHQLDLRLDRTWTLRRSVVSAYLDVQNIYNRQNAEGVLYNHDYSSTHTVVGVPILPVLGVKVNY